ncbi:Alpha beta hydrolase [Datura stramonium]|uniref:Alpha beta hydrolase n=1 Tax=Datura stramonium TaxID=4076 RepID=A0ABS8SCZ4_DATST|nr:Alpha beta hydrolase [Datura stramonium]
MGNIFAVTKPILHGVMKAVGMTSQLVEIEPGTTMHFWVPTASIHPNNKSPNKPPKPAVVFVHGFVANGIITWIFQLLSLRSSDFAVYIPDLLFFGDSITDRPQRSTTFQAECLAKGMMKLGVEKFSLVGLSYGGMVGFKLAQLYPHVVESMVMSSTVIEMTESISNASLKNIGFTNWPDYLLPKTVSGLRLLLSIGSHKLPWLPEFFYRDFLERIYILCGDDDKIFNMTFSDNMKEKLGENTTIQYIKNAGHLVQLERPCTYNHYLKKFLSNLSTDFANM